MLHIFTWSGGNFHWHHRGNEKENQWLVRHQQGGTGFCLQEGKGWVHLLCTRIRTDTIIHRQHHCADGVFLFNHREQSLTPIFLSSSDLPCRTNEAVDSTPYWHTVEPPWLLPTSLFFCHFPLLISIRLPPHFLHLFVPLLCIQIRHEGNAQLLIAGMQMHQQREEPQQRRRRRKKRRYTKHQRSRR